MGKDSSTRHRLGARPVRDNVVSMRGTSTTPPADGEPDTRPTIILEPGKFHRAVAESEDALLTSGLQVYQRDNALCQVIGLEDSLNKEGRWKPAGAAQIVAVETSHLLSMLSRSAKYYKPRRSKDGEEKYAPCDPPARLADAIRSNPEPKAPKLVGFVEAPFVGPNGRIHDTPGYVE